MWCSVHIRNRICTVVLYVRGGGCWRFGRCSHGKTVKVVASLCLVLAILGPFVIFCSSPFQLVMFNVSPGLAVCRPEAEVRHNGRHIHAVNKRRFLPLSGQQPGPVDLGSHERSRELSEQAFDDGNDEFKWRYFKFIFLWVPHVVELFRPFSRWSCNCSN